MKADNTKKKSPIMISALFALLAWFAIGLQLCIAMPAYYSAGRTTGGALVDFFSFFTIESNLLVACSLTVVTLGKSSGNFFSRGGLLTAIAVYITIVGLVYNLVLRQLWHPQGLARVADELLHSVSPVLFIIYWFAFVPKLGITYKGALSWLWFPLIYIVYILLRGAAFGFYPYPFLKVDELGYTRVGINIAVLILVFLAMSMLFAFIARKTSKKEVV